MAAILGHCVALGLFIFSFPGGQLREGLQPALAPLVYCGLLAVKPALQPQSAVIAAGRALQAHPADMAALARSREGFVRREYYYKPVAEELQAEKKLFLERAPVFNTLPQQREPVLLFHPLLPYQLQLYFKDRQDVHIELQFKIHETLNRNAIEIKRKVSSGNIEADLLSLRYISHYLFIQKGGFQTNRWHPVKIDLSTAE
ncbi:MAG TPA: hypothetical protein PLF03_03285 [Candidatus Omnitrophota bacterium]|nr:hypothetical protein [Candidatus Omnitrophota bacterium]